MTLPGISKGEWIKAVAHWRDGDTAFISVAFTWRLPEARRLTEYYRAIGARVVRVGGPAVFTEKAKVYLADLDVKLGGSIPDTIVRHNPMATRASYGCPVDCAFCIVSKMDGKAFTLLPDFVVRPVLCDDNLSALPADYQQHIIDRYLKTGVPLLDANSGFEPKTFDEDVFQRWKPILKGPWRFGFDEETEGEAVARVFKMLKGRLSRKIQVYTMIGHEPFEVCMARIRKVIESGGEPYVQADDSTQLFEERAQGSLRLDGSQTQAGAAMGKSAPMAQDAELCRLQRLDQNERFTAPGHGYHGDIAVSGGYQPKPGPRPALPSANSGVTRNLADHTAPPLPPPTPIEKGGFPRSFAIEIFALLGWAFFIFVLVSAVRR